MKKRDNKKEKIELGDLVEIESVETIHLGYDGYWEDAENARYMKMGVVVEIESVLDEWYNKQPLYQDGIYIVLTSDGRKEKYFPYEIRKLKAKIDGKK